MLISPLRLIGIVAVVSAAVLVTPSVSLAQSEVDLFGGFGSSDHADADDQHDPGTRMQAGEGAVVGRAFNADGGTAIRGVTVILQFPVSPDGSSAGQEVQITDSDGAFEFPSVPPGIGYTLSFVKSGFRSSVMANVEVSAAEMKRADFPLPPLAATEAGGLLDLEAFVVDEAVAGQMVQNLELRLESDALMNLMSAEDLSRFAASDVAEALRRVAGVNIVEGQFAIIRGLEDRYSSTLYNGAVVPSPDPNKQSVQLDLFPSEIVHNIGVSKTFTPTQPSNSSGGSIDISTHGVPDEFTLQVKIGAGYNTNAINQFLVLEPGNPVGREKSGASTTELDMGFFLGGRLETKQREIRYKGVFNYETDYKTARGFQEGHAPRLGNPSRFNPQTGGLIPGLLRLSDSRFDLLTSGFQEKWTGYGGLGFDIDEAAHHKIDASVFYTRVSQEIVQTRDNGHLPGFDHGPAIENAKTSPDTLSRNLWIDPAGVVVPDDEVRATISNWFIGTFRDVTDEEPGRAGGLWWAPYAQSQSFERERDLLITQLNGEHLLPEAGDLEITWAGNWARTRQTDFSRRLRYFYEPDDPLQAVTPDSNGDYPIDSFNFPVQADELGAGQWANQTAEVLESSTDIVEKQGFARIDLSQGWDPFEQVLFDFKAGGWFERARRDVAATYLESPTSKRGLEAAVFADTPLELGRAAFDDLVFDDEIGAIASTRFQTSEAERLIGALGLSAKVTFFEDIDVFGGVRIEKIQIGSVNDPLTGELEADGSPRLILGAPSTFPLVYIFGDRLDNPTDRRPDLPQFINEVPSAPPADTVWNDQLLNLDLQPNNGPYVDLITEDQILDFVNGRIDEWRFLPSAGANWRPVEGASLRAAYSQTVARPSLREIGYYVSVEPGSDDLVLGNPRLELSDVQSWDGRVEYSWGDFGDLVAFSGFYKQIEKPIESIVIQNPFDLSGSNSAYYRTFFNNRNDAKLWGIEVEARKNLGFPGFGIGEHFTIGGNFTWIEARVKRSEEEVRRFDRFFLDASMPPAERQQPNTLEGDRRLFGQPRWIANADISFDQDDWGTHVTLACFGISDILNAAGSASLSSNGNTVAGVLDRYVDAFYRLDLVIGQRIDFDFIPGDLGFQFSAKNLTNSVRGLFYDPGRTSEKVYERRFRIGRDFKFALTYDW